MAEEEKSEKKLKRIALSLQKIVECPICLDTIKVPFKTCSRGHGLCCSCCDKLEECPTCQGPFTAENPVCLKNLLEALPRLCQYSDDGCDEVLEPGSDHEVYCGYRPIACRNNCGVTVPLIKLMEHYKTDHPKRSICTKMTHGIIWPEFDPKEGRKSNSPVLLFNNIFWIIVHNDTAKKLLKCSFQATPIGKLRSNYFVKVTFSNGNFVYTSTLKPSVSGSCQIEEEDEKEDCCGPEVEEDYCMKIPQSILHRFVNAKQELRYTLDFFEEDT